MPVDHGKTTLVDELLKQSGTFRANEKTVERMMDSNDLEKRGITIAKTTSVEWNDTASASSTPGHADFGGGWSILDMVDGVIVLVDSAEGPMPQTKFVVSKPLRSACARCGGQQGRQGRAPRGRVLNGFDLFANLDAPTTSSISRSHGSGKMNGCRNSMTANMDELFRWWWTDIADAEIGRRPFRSSPPRFRQTLLSASDQTHPVRLVKPNGRSRC